MKNDSHDETRSSEPGSLEERLVARAQRHRLEREELQRLRDVLLREGDAAPSLTTESSARRSRRATGNSPAPDSCEHPPASSPRPGRGTLFALTLAAAAIVLLSLRLDLFEPESHPELWPERLALEAAELDITGSPPFIESADLAHISAEIPSVEFTLEHAERLSGRDLRLVGGSSSTLSGRPAAALRYDTPEGRTVTLLQLPLVEGERENPPDKPCMLNKGSFRIEVWEEDGRAFCLLEERDGILRSGKQHSIQ